MKQIEYFPNTGETFFADELEPCPFCGSVPELNFIGNDYTKSRKVVVKCKKCRIQRTDAAIRFDHKWVALNAIKSWNTRVK
jgi:hypothetical protein